LLPRARSYRTILLFCCVYLLGLVMLTCCAGLVPGWAPRAGEEPTRKQTALLLLALYVVALGTGGIKPNVSAFGADQFDTHNPRHVKAKASFFNWFYLVINCGSLLASVVVVYIQENVSWEVGFAIPTCAMALAVLCFVGGSRRYRHAVRPPGATSPITRAVAVVAAALGASLREVLCCSPRTLRTLGEADADAAAAGAPAPAQLPSPDSSPELAEAASVPSLPRWLKLATHDYGGRFTDAQVEEVAMVLHLLPVMCTGIVYWAVYAQMGSVFVLQGAQMDRRVGRGGFVVPAASLSTFDTLAVIALIPFFERVVYRRAARAGRKFTPLQRTGAGHLFAVAAMLAAAVLERKRLDAARRGELLSIFWQSFQYLLIGASEVLAVVAQLEFFYSSSPDSMRSCAMALQLAATAMGGFLASALLSTVARTTEQAGVPWFTQDLNDGRLDLFFLLLGARCGRSIAPVLTRLTRTAGLMFADFLLFVFVASRSVYVRITPSAAAARERRRAAARAQRPPRSAPIGVRAVVGAVAAVLPQSFSSGDFYGRSLVPKPDIPARTGVR